MIAASAIEHQSWRVTLIDGSGRVLNAYDDDDTGVYQMGPRGTHKIGDTILPDSFLADPDFGGVRNPRGQVFVGIPMDYEIKRAASEAAQMGDIEVAFKSRHGGSLDLKGLPGHGPYDGFLFGGKYVTLREAGDMLAGYNGKSHGYSLDTTLRLTGAYQQGRLEFMITLLSLTLKTWGPRPYYGETNYAGSRIVYGYSSDLASYRRPLASFMFATEPQRQGNQ